MNKLFSLLIICIIFFAKIVNAQSLIRDGETEKFLHDLTAPIFAAANLNSKNIKIYIVNDNSINAFVSGGQNIFINTGLIQKYSTPDALIGVIAHESGHIAGGHLARSGEGAAGAENAMLLSYLLGIGAIVSGAPDAGMAVIVGGSQTAQRLYMKFTRTQEEAADQYAIQYLQKMHYPPTGLIKLLEFFENELVGYKGQIDEYLLSHPISNKRIELLKERTKNWNFSDTKINKALQPQMNRVLLKLAGFIENPDAIIAAFKNNDDLDACYIKSIAYFRKGEIAKAANLLNSVIAKSEKVKNTEEITQLGFLYELQGQILFESGDLENAIIAYSKSIKLIPKEYSSLAEISFAAAILQLKTNDSDMIKLAIRNLNDAEKYENQTPMLFKLLADAYHKIGNEGRSYLALAKYNSLLKEKDKTKKYAKKATETLDKSDKSALLQADDLLDDNEEKEEETK